MENELDTYKKNRIENLIKNFNSKLFTLKSLLRNNFGKIKNIRLRIKQKQMQINNLVNSYNNTINILKQTLNEDIKNINAFTPKQITLTPTNKKNALLVGINYTGTKNELFGCINDVNSINDKISQTFDNITIMTDLTYLKPTKKNILDEFKTLLTNSSTGDFLFFLYSGHGSYILDKNKDENTPYDQLIVSCDFNVILDDELKSVILSNLKNNVTLFCMFDSCFSGSVLDLRYQYMDSLNYDNFTENVKETETPGNIFMISGCNDYQTSTEISTNNKTNGAMTWSLLEVLKQTPSCSWRELLKNMRNLLKKNNFEQIPQFSSGTFMNIDTIVFI